MYKKSIYTIGYTLFQQGDYIDVNELFDTLEKYNINFLVDVRSVPFSKLYPQCNSDNMEIIGKKRGVPYMHMPEIGAKAKDEKNVFSHAQDIFFESAVFPIAKSYRPEKTELQGQDEIVDFHKFRQDDFFVKGIERIKTAYEKNFTLCLMCSEKKPIDCHRYFLISKVLEQRFGDWLEVKHIIRNDDGNIGLINNSDLDRQLEEYVCITKHILGPMFKNEILEKYHGKTEQEQINDFCDRYWNLLHGWKRFNTK